MAKDPSVSARRLDFKQSYESMDFTWGYKLLLEVALVLQLVGPGEDTIFHPDCHREFP